MRIADVLRTKGPMVHSVEGSMRVADLLAELAQQNIGAVIVCEGETVAGIVSERDIVRRMAERGAGLLDEQLGNIMTTSVVTCTPEDTVDGVMRLMTQRRFRHVPVLVDGRLGGIVSIGDLVSARMRELEQEREQLESYITSG